MEAKNLLKFPNNGKPLARFITFPGAESIGYWRMGMPFVGVHKLGVYGMISDKLLSRYEVQADDKKNGTRTLVVATHLTYLDAEKTLETLKTYEKGSIRVVIDVDDYVWRADILRLTSKQKQQFSDTLRAATVVTTTTEYLQKKIKEHSGVQAWIVPNTIPEAEFRLPQPRKDGEKLRVIYTGAFQHSSEWPMLKEMIERTADFAKWILFYGRTKDKSGFENYVVPEPLKDLKNIEWQVPQDAQFFLRTAYNTIPHVAVAPLAMTFTNLAKSDLKILEAGALGCAVITQDLKPYKDWGHKVEFVDGFVDKLKELNENEALRFQIAEEATNYAWERRLESAQYLGKLYAAYTYGQ